MLIKNLAAVLACTALLVSNAVNATEIKILCASGMREVVSELQPQLARIAGQQVSISFGEAGDLRKQLADADGYEHICSESCASKALSKWLAQANGNLVRPSTKELSPHSKPVSAIQ